MKLFSGKNKKEGYLAISLFPDALCVAHTRRVEGGKPAVTLCGLESVDTANAGQMEKLARDIHFADYHCTTLLPDNDYQMMVLEAPNVPRDELKTAVRWRLKDMLDYHVDDATLDVLDIPGDKNGPARGHSMYVVAARNEFVQKLVNLFDQSRIPLEVIDIPEMAQRNVASLLEEPDRGLAMLSFGREGGLLTITYNGELYLARHIDIPVQQLENPDVERRQANLDRITLELQRSFDSFERQFSFISISRLVLAPMSKDLGLQEYLAANLYLPVSLLDLTDVLDCSKVPALQHQEQQAQFFLTLGASLRVEGKVL
jgi:MSHA biogenesis protein MshI